MYASKIKNTPSLPSEDSDLLENIETGSDKDKPQLKQIKTSNHAHHLKLVDYVCDEN